MKILLLENSSAKAQKIIGLLQRSNHIVVPRFCTDDTKNELRLNKYDALIVDLKVPKKNGKSEDISYGISLIQYIFDGVRDTIYRPKIVIVLSEYLSCETMQSLQAFPISIIPYTPTESWKKPLINRLNYYDRLKYDIAIITAVEVEFEAAKSWGWQNGHDIPDFTYYYKELKNRDGKKLKLVLVKLNRMGMVCATNTTDRVIQYFEPRCIIMSGICAGRKNATALGDIIVAATAWDYGSGSIEEIKKTQQKKEIKFNPDPDYIALSLKNTNVFDWYTWDKIETLKSELAKYAKDKYEGKLLEVIKEEQKRKTKLHQGSMATGAAVIKAEQFVNMFVKEQNRKYSGLDMETYGVYYAAKHSTVQDFFVVKCVSDLADEHKGDEFQDYCARLSAALTMDFIIKKYTF